MEKWYIFLFLSLFSSASILITWFVCQFLFACPFIAFLYFFACLVLIVGPFLFFLFVFLFQKSSFIFLKPFNLIKHFLFYFLVLGLFKFALFLCLYLLGNFPIEADSFLIVIKGMVFFKLILKGSVMIHMGILLLCKDWKKVINECVWFTSKLFLKNPFFIKWHISNVYFIVFMSIVPFMKLFVQDLLLSLQYWENFFNIFPIYGLII